MMVSWHDYSKLIISIGGALAVLATLWKWASRAIVTPLSRWFRFLNAAIAELSPNGGASIFDRIKRIDSSTQLASGRVLTLMDRAPQPVFECGPEGDCTYVNHAFCDLFDITRDDALGKGWYHALHPEDRQRVYEAWMASVSNGVAYECDYRIRYTHDDNSETVTHVRATAHPMVGGLNQVIGYSGTVRPLP